MSKRIEVKRGRGRPLEPNSKLGKCERKYKQLTNLGKSRASIVAAFQKIEVNGEKVSKQTAEVYFHLVQKRIAKAAELVAQAKAANAPAPEAQAATA